MINPSEYKDRYENLTVAGSGKIKVRKYRLGSIARFYDPTGVTKFIDKLSKNTENIELEVDTDNGPKQVTLFAKKFSVPAGGFNEWAAMARYTFKGKGAPEHCQLVLQLADHWGILGGSMQDYADKYLGLDCNGFVGNYLWHTKPAKAGDAPRPWTDLGVGNHDKGPDCGISGYLDPPRRYVSDWNDLHPGFSYVLGRVNTATNQVIDGGGTTLDRIGHVVISEPGAMMMKRINGIDTKGLRVIESTGGALDPGLTDSWYFLKNPAKTKPANKVFEILRESMAPGHKEYSFKIAV
jgi:hypothetical protein